MKRLFYLTLIILSIAGTQVQAQVPGFMGKKLAIGYNLDVGFPLFRGGDWKDFSVSSKYNGENGGTWSLYPRHNINIEYVVGKSVSLEGSVGVSKSGLLTYENEDDNLRNEYPGLSSYYDTDPYNTAKSYDYLRVNNRMYRIGINVFSDNYIAPHGNYWNFSYIQNQGTVQYVLDGTAKDLSRITNHGFMITKGYRRIILSSVIIDFGFGFGYAFGGKKSEDRSLSSSNYYGVPVSTIDMQTSALNSSILFNGHISVKYLIPKFRK